MTALKRAGFEMGNGRARRRLTGLLAAGLALAIAPAAFAQTPPSTPPSTLASTLAADFNEGLEGWLSEGVSCSSSGACTIANRLAPRDGAPAPALSTSVRTSLNALGAVTGQGTWRSPAFVPAAVPATSTQPRESWLLRLDRFAKVGGIDIGGQAVYRLQLLDETTKKTAELATVVLTKSDRVWRSHEIAVAAGQVEPGHQYRVKIVTTATSQAGVGNEISVFFDNISLAPASAPLRIASNKNARRLLRIDTRSAQAARRGMFKNEVRLRIFCKPSSLRRCEGTAKVRTRDPVNPGLRGSHSRKRVTIGSTAYVCPVRHICFIKIPITTRTQRWIRAKGNPSIPSVALVTVLDEKGIQQTLDKPISVRAR